MKKRNVIKKFLSSAVILAMMFTMVPSMAFAGTMPDDAYNVDREWYNFRNNQENNAVTDVKTPIDSQTASLKFAKKFGTGWAAAPTPPIILDGCLYIGVANKILKLDKLTGEKLAESDEMFGNVGYAMNPLIYADGLLFCQVGNGSIQAIDYKTLKCVWHSKPVGGQTVSPISYVKANDGNGYVYTGTWNGENKDGSFVCISTDKTGGNLGASSNGKGGYTKDATWIFQPSGDGAKDNPDLKYDEVLNATLSEKGNVARRGFYWAGAYTSENFIAVGTDDGTRESDYTRNAVFYTLDPVTGDVIDRIDGIKGDIRTTVVYDNGYLYFSTKGGQLHKVSVDSSGNLGADSYVDLGGMTTASPAVYGNKIYIGVCGQGGQFNPDGGHGFAVVDNSKPALDSTSELYRIPIKGYPQASALISTAYANEDFDKDGKADGRVYIYFTYNAVPGGIYYTYDTADQKEAAKMSKELFIPPADKQQYCISTICADREGTLYYKNDSCYLMAVETNPAVITDIQATDDASKEVAWDRAFDQTVTEYNLKTSKDAKHLNIKLTLPEGVTATATANGKPCTGDATTFKAVLEGESTDICITSTKGEMSKDYILHVKKMSTNATLENMYLSQSNTPGADKYVITPEFTPNNLDYVCDMTGKPDPEFGFYRVWLKPTEPGTKIEVVGDDNVKRIDSFNDRAYKAIYLKDLSKTAKLTINVTAEAGGEPTVYTLTILRAVKAEGMTLDKASYKLDVTDEAFRLEPVFTPADTTDKTVTWSSSKDETATVEDGLVTPKKAGKADIAAVSNSNPNLMAKCTVTVTDKAADVDVLIEKIGTVTLEKKADIDAARKAYDALTAKQKDRVKKLNVLEKAEAEYKVLHDQAEQDKADKAAAAKVDTLIEKIGTVTLEKKSDIDAARKAYDALTAKQKTYVKKLEVLEKAEADYKVLYDQAEKEQLDKAAAAEVDKLIEKIGTVTLEKKSDIDAARKAYDALTAKQKTYVKKLEVLEKAEADYKALHDQEEKDKAAAAEVDKLIEKIGTVTLEKKSDIDVARKAYDALTAKQKTYVKKLEVLEKAEADYKVLYDQAEKDKADKAAADAVVEKIDAIGTVTLEKEEAVKNARAAYEVLTADQKKYVGADKVKVLEDAEKALEELKLDALKDKAKADLENYKDLNEYRDAEKNQLNKIIADTVKAVDAAKDTAEVEKLVKDAKAEMDKVKTDAQLTEEENNNKPLPPNPESGDTGNGGSGNAGSDDQATDKPVQKPGTGVQTGDTNNIAMFAVVLGAALAAVIAMIFRRKRMNK